MKNSIMSTLSQHVLALSQATIAGHGNFQINGMALKPKPSSMVTLVLSPSSWKDQNLPHELKVLPNILRIVAHKQEEKKIIINQTL